MSASSQQSISVRALAKAMTSNLITQLLVGCFMAFPGASMDVLLVQFHWTIADFGTSALIQGIFAFLGNIFANWRVPSRPNLTTELRISQFFVLAGVAIVYGWEFLVSPLPFHLPAITRALGFAFIGFGVGIQAIVNNTQALRSHAPSSALMLVAFTFTFGALVFPFLTGFFLASIPEFTTHNWKLILLPIFLLATWNALWPITGRLTKSQTQMTEYPNSHSHSPQSDTGTATTDTGTATTDTGTATTDTAAPPATATSTSQTKPPAFLPYALGFLLFLYMGIEINVTNGIALLGIQLNSIPNSLARFAPSALWLGILMSRFVTAIFPLQPARFRVWTWQASVPLTILLAALAIFPFSTIAWFTLIITIGCFLGPFYGFIVGQSSHLYHGDTVAKNAATIATIGSAGGILMPFLFGQIAEFQGLRTGFVFMVATAATLFVCAILVAILGVKPKKN